MGFGKLTNEWGERMNMLRAGLVGGAAAVVGILAAVGVTLGVMFRYVQSLFVVHCAQKPHDTIIIGHGSL